MLVSALLTSAGINIGLCVGLLCLYSVLSKQPWNARVYKPRLVSEGKVGNADPFNLYRLVPSPGWIFKAWQVPDDEFLKVAGFDAYVFIRIFNFSLRVFTTATVIGMFVLLPINYLSDGLSKIDIADIASQSLDLFSISNVASGSKRLWVHFCALYLISGITCLLLYMEYKGIAIKRFEYLNSSPPQPHHFTILVRGIPKSGQHSMSNTVEDFFTQSRPSFYLSHQMVYQTGKIQSLLNEAEKLYDRISSLDSTSQADRKQKHTGFLGLFGAKADPVDIYTKQLEDVQESVRLRQSEVYHMTKELPAAFVSFRTRYSASVATQVLQSSNPLLWVTAPAPEPRDIYWPFLSASYLQLWISKFVVIVATFFLTILFILPVTLVQGLVQLTALETYFPFLKKVLKLKIVSNIVTGYLPSLILQLFMYFVPSIMMAFSAMQGSVSNSGKQKSACTKVLYFTIWTVFFLTLFSGSAISQIETMLSNPKDIPRQLAIVVPGQATFFITYVLTSGWTGLSLEIARVFPLIKDFFKRHFSDKIANEDCSSPFPYHRDIPKVLLFGLIGLTYSVLAPLILPFLLVYFFFGYIFFRNQLLKVYVPAFETSGQFWPVVHNSTIFSLVLMQVIGIGIFGVKKLPEASIWIAPLIVLTLLFNDYCRKRFLPIFNRYPAEILIKRDNNDESNPQELESFYEYLATAYRDPCLQQLQNSTDNDSSRMSLLT